MESHRVIGEQITPDGSAVVLSRKPILRERLTHIEAGIHDQLSRIDRLSPEVSVPITELALSVLELIKTVKSHHAAGTY